MKYFPQGFEVNMNIIGKKVKITDWLSAFNNKIGTIINKDNDYYSIRFNLNCTINFFLEKNFTIIDDNNNYLINFKNNSNICNWCKEKLKLKQIILNKRFFIYYCPKCLR